jgi:hypothetical protein
LLFEKIIEFKLDKIISETNQVIKYFRRLKILLVLIQLGRMNLMTRQEIKPEIALIVNQDAELTIEIDLLTTIPGIGKLTSGHKFS